MIIRSVQETENTRHLFVLNGHKYFLSLAVLTGSPIKVNPTRIANISLHVDGRDLPNKSTDLLKALMDAWTIHLGFAKKIHDYWRVKWLRS